MVESLLGEGVLVNFPKGEKDFRSPLHSAIYLGNLEVVKKLIFRGASPNVPNANFETPLMIAAKMSRNEMTDLMLLSRGLKNCSNRQNFTHLHIACMRNQVQVVKNLMESKADINSAVKLDSIQWPGYTALHFAVQFQCTEMVEFLLSVGADISVKDAKQLTPLHLADMSRNEQLIDMILAVHKDFVSNPQNSEGLSHFHIACTRNKPELVEPFLKIGINIQESIPDSSMNWPCFTAIDFAIYYECVNVVRLLLLYGANVQSDYQLNRIRNAYDVGNGELVNLLLTNDRLTNKVFDIERISDVHVACIKNNCDYFKDALTSNKGIFNSHVGKNCTPLHLAIEYKHSELIELMLDHDADINIQNGDGKSALHLAFEQNMKDVVNLIFSNHKHFNRNPVDNDGFSHLHIACIQGEVEVVERLLECGADVNSSVNFDSMFRPGYTPLHFAALFKRAAVLLILLRYGARYSVVDKCNVSVLDVAISLSCDFQQNRSAFRIMSIILSHHSRYKDESFNDRGFSRLHVWNGSMVPTICDMNEVIEFIDEHPSDVNKTVHILNTPWDGCTPLHLALELGDIELANVLIKKGANLLCKAANGDTPLHLISNYAELPRDTSTLLNYVTVQQNPIGSEGFSFFHVACAIGNIELIAFFLSRGVSPNSPSKMKMYEFDDKAPLHMVALSNSSTGVEISLLLLQFGANPSARDCEKNTPLHFVHGHCHPKFIEVLVDHGANVNALNAVFETPLLALCKNIHGEDLEIFQEKLELLLDNGADINIADEKGATPLTLGSWYSASHLPLIEILLKHVIKLEAVGFYVSKINQIAYSSLLRRFTDDLHFNEINYDELCITELERMKQIFIDNHTPLFNVLFKNLNQLAMISENPALHQIIASHDFREKYPNYGPMLKMQLRKGKSRRPLLLVSKKAFNSLVGISLPGACVESVLQNLNENDLKNIIMA